MQKAPITAIITHFNRSEGVERALQSVLRQTVAPSEILLVDDHSSPEHVEVLRKKYAGAATLVLLEQNAGPGAARNAGCEAATQEFVAFLDDDDEWAPTKLEEQWKAICNDPTLDGVTCALHVHHADGRNEVWRHHTPDHHTLQAALVATPALPSSFLLRNSVLQKVGGFDPRLRFFEDWDLCIRLMKAGARLRHLGEPLVEYPTGGMNQATSKWLRLNLGRFRILFRHADIYRQQIGYSGMIRLAGSLFRRAGLERGGIWGRLAYSVGSIPKPGLLGHLLSTGRMSDDGFDY